MDEERSCKRCLKNFFSEYKNRLYCSDYCKLKSYKERNYEKLRSWNNSYRKKVYWGKERNSKEYKIKQSKYFKIWYIKNKKRKVDKIKSKKK